MTIITKEITQEQYEKSKSEPLAFRTEIEADLPKEWVCGYGWYGYDTYESEDGKYYIRHSIGDSCD